ncbi:MAG: hypothetical protein C0623_07185, partial [Desulfuromonas sp.]
MEKKIMKQAALLLLLVLILALPVCAVAASSGYGSSSTAGISSGHGGGVTLIDRRMMNELDAKRHRTISVESVSLQAESSKLSLLILFGGVVVMVGVGVGISRTRFFADLNIGGKLATGFGTVVLIGALLGMGSYYFMDTINNDYDAALGALDLDMMASEIGSLEKDFIIYGIQDNARGEKIAEEIKGLVAEYTGDLATMNNFGLSSQVNREIDRVRGNVAEYDKTFADLVEYYHQIERDKETLEELSHTMGRELAEVVHAHEAELDAIENASRIDVGQLKLQTKMVEELFEAELRVAMIGAEEAEFLLDKRIARIEPMERLLGELVGHLAVARNLIPQLTTSQAEQAADLRMLAQAEREVQEYIEALSETIVAELRVEADLVDAREELAHIESLASGIANHLDGEAESSKEQANMLMIVMMLLAAAVGTVIAFFVTRSITA